MNRLPDLNKAAIRQQLVIFGKEPLYSDTQIAVQGPSITPPYPYPHHLKISQQPKCLYWQFLEGTSKLLANFLTVLTPVNLAHRFWGVFSAFANDFFQDTKDEPPAVGGPEEDYQRD